MVKKEATQQGNGEDNKGEGNAPVIKKSNALPKTTSESSAAGLGLFSLLAATVLGRRKKEDK